MALFAALVRNDGSPAGAPYNVAMGNDAYLQPYRESARRHGPSFKATLWANRRSQRTRFEAFVDMCGFAGKRILDAGCSRGDFAQFLIESDIDFKHYVGIDGLAEVIEHAQQRGLPRCRFHVGDLLHEPALFRTGGPQIVCISGTLNTMTDEQVMAFLESAWRAAGELLIFNFLSDRVGASAPPQTKPARRLDTMRLLDWATRHSCLTSFRQDYFKAGHDATILMRKGE